MIQTVFAATLKNGFVELWGAGHEAHSFVCGLHVGRLSDASRLVPVDECTEELLEFIEESFRLVCLS